MKNKGYILSAIEQFHDNSLYLPTRTIYFGSSYALAGSEFPDYVDGYTAGQVIRNLHVLDAIKHERIILILNTPGGNWEEGMAIYDTIKIIKSPVYIIGIGKVYSMGSIIFQAGNKRLLTPNTYMMIHDGTDGFEGSAKAFEAWAKNSKEIRSKMYQIYYDKMIKKNSEITLKKIEEMCSHDTIFTSQGAVKIGLADSIMRKLLK